MNKYYDYPGVIHIHSTYSDGLGGPQSIIKAANNAGCNYMVLTDHDTLKGLEHEGWYGNTLVLTGEEITVGNNQGHYLAMGLSREVTPRQSPQETIDAVLEQGGIGFIAHPFVDKTLQMLFCLTPVLWQDWNVSGFTGLEIWNYSVDWIDNFHGPLDYFQGLLNPDHFINGPPKETLRKWDELLHNRKVSGIGGVDAHGYFYSYKRMFKTLRTHVILESPLSFQENDFKQDKKAIYDALAKGNSYISYDSLAKADGFLFTADNGQRKAIMGDKLPVGTGVTLKIAAPRQGFWRLVKDGKVVASVSDFKSLIRTVYEPGAYRTEVFLKDGSGKKRPWIYSNPIYLYK